MDVDGLDDSPDFDAMTREEIREWLDDPDNVARAIGDISRWRRNDGQSMVINYPPSDDDVEIPITLAPDQLVMIDDVCARIDATGNNDGPGYSDRSSVVRAAVAWFMLMVKGGEDERRKIDGPDVAVPLRYDTPHNSRSLLLCGTADHPQQLDTDSQTTPVMLPYELARKLSKRRWKYLAAEEQVIDHLRDTDQRMPS